MSMGYTPGFFGNGPKTGNYRVLTDMTWTRGWKNIQAAGVADFMLVESVNREHEGRIALPLY